MGQIRADVGVRGALMICGTGSDVDKSHVVAGLCRLLHRRGVRVAPFKAQNMSLNSYVTAAGDEIGRAQATQAFAAGIQPEVAMNPVLLKSSGPGRCQVVVNGHPAGQCTAAQYHDYKPELFATVLQALAELRARFDVVLLEGAGGAAEINLLDRDIVNLPVAAAAGIKAIIVGDIDRGGVFAALYGTHALLPPQQRSCVGGFVINKLRGDPALLLDGCQRLAHATGVPTLGVLPYIDGVALDAEDSLALAGPAPSPATVTPTVLDVAAIRWPHLANTTDLDPLAIEPGVGVRWVDHAAALGHPDLIVLPGTKATVADLAWLRAAGLDTALEGTDATLVGICGGYQALGRTIHDPSGVEAPPDSRIQGLGWLEVHTTFFPDKTLAQHAGTAGTAPVNGYEIHHGRTVPAAGTTPWLTLNGRPEGATKETSRRIVFGTNLHGLFDNDPFRRTFLTGLATQRRIRFRPAATSFAAARAAQLDRLGDLVEAHLNLAAIQELVEQARG